MAALDVADTGQSHSDFKKRAVVLFDNKFRTSDPSFATRYPKPFFELPESVLCDQDIFNRFGYWALNVHLIEEGNINAGQHLSGGVICNIIGALINLLNDKYGTAGCQASRDFLSCLAKNGTTPSARWLYGLKFKILGESFERAVKNGEKLDNSEVPIYLLHVKRMNEVCRMRSAC